ncbi:very large A-kinase anchor protein [Gastrophryne carolinensis]
MSGVRRAGSWQDEVARGFSRLFSRGSSQEEDQGEPSEEPDRGSPEPGARPEPTPAARLFFRRSTDSQAPGRTFPRLFSRSSSQEPGDPEDPEDGRSQPDSDIATTITITTDTITSASFYYCCYCFIATTATIPIAIGTFTATTATITITIATFTATTATITSSAVSPITTAIITITNIVFTATITIAIVLLPPGASPGARPRKGGTRRMAAPSLTGSLHPAHTTTHTITISTATITAITATITTTTATITSAVSPSITAATISITTIRFTAITATIHIAISTFTATTATITITIATFTATTATITSSAVSPYITTATITINNIMFTSTITIASTKYKTIDFSMGLSGHKEKNGNENSDVQERLTSSLPEQVKEDQSSLPPCQVSSESEEQKDKDVIQNSKGFDTEKQSRENFLNFLGNLFHFSPKTSQGNAKQAVSTQEPFKNNEDTQVINNLDEEDLPQERTEDVSTSDLEQRAQTQSNMDSNMEAAQEVIEQEQQTISPSRPKINGHHLEAPAVTYGTYRGSRRIRKLLKRRPDNNSPIPEKEENSEKENNSTGDVGADDEIDMKLDRLQNEMLSSFSNKKCRMQPEDQIPSQAGELNLHGCEGLNPNSEDYPKPGSMDTSKMSNNVYPSTVESSQISDNLELKKERLSHLLADQSPDNDDSSKFSTDLQAKRLNSQVNILNGLQPNDEECVDNSHDREESLGSNGRTISNSDLVLSPENSLDISESQQIIASESLKNSDNTKASNASIDVSQYTEGQTIAPSHLQLTSNNNLPILEHTIPNSNECLNLVDDLQTKVDTSIDPSKENISEPSNELLSIPENISDLSEKNSEALQMYVEKTSSTFVENSNGLNPVLEDSLIISNANKCLSDTEHLQKNVNIISDTLVDSSCQKSGNIYISNHYYVQGANVNTTSLDPSLQNEMPTNVHSYTSVDLSQDKQEDSEKASCRQNSTILPNLQTDLVNISPVLEHLQATTEGPKSLSELQLETEESIPNTILENTSMFPQPSSANKIINITTAKIGPNIISRFNSGSMVIGPENTAKEEVHVEHLSTSQTNVIPKINQNISEELNQNVKNIPNVTVDLQHEDKLHSHDLQDLQDLKSTEILANNISTNRSSVGTNTSFVNNFNLPFTSVYDNDKMSRTNQVNGSVQDTLVHPEKHFLENQLSSLTQDKNDGTRTVRTISIDNGIECQSPSTSISGTPPSPSNFINIRGDSPLPYTDVTDSGIVSSQAYTPEEHIPVKTVSSEIFSKNISDSFMVEQDSKEYRCSETEMGNSDNTVPSAHLLDDMCKLRDAPTIKETDRLADANNLPKFESVLFTSKRGSTNGKVNVNMNPEVYVAKVSVKSVNIEEVKLSPYAFQSDIISVSKVESPTFEKELICLPNVSPPPPEAECDNTFKKRQENNEDVKYTKVDSEKKQQDKNSPNLFLESNSYNKPTHVEKTEVILDDIDMFPDVYINEKIPQYTFLEKGLPEISNKSPDVLIENLKNNNLTIDTSEDILNISLQTTTSDSESLLCNNSLWDPDEDVTHREPNKLGHAILHSTLRSDVTFTDQSDINSLDSESPKRISSSIGVSELSDKLFEDSANEIIFSVLHSSFEELQIINKNTINIPRLTLVQEKKIHSNFQSEDNTETRDTSFGLSMDPVVLISEGTWTSGDVVTDQDNDKGHSQENVSLASHNTISPNSYKEGKLEEGSNNVVKVDSYLDIEAKIQGEMENVTLYMEQEGSSSKSLETEGSMYQHIPDITISPGNTLETELEPFHFSVYSSKYVEIESDDESTDDDSSGSEEAQATDSFLSQSLRRVKIYPFSLSPIYENDSSCEDTMSCRSSPGQKEGTTAGSANEHTSILSLLQSVSDRLMENNMDEMSSGENVTSVIEDVSGPPEDKFVSTNFNLDVQKVLENEKKSGLFITKSDNRRNPTVGRQSLLLNLSLPSATYGGKSEINSNSAAESNSSPLTTNETALITDKDLSPNDAPDNAHSPVKVETDSRLSQLKSETEHKPRLSSSSIYYQYFHSSQIYPPYAENKESPTEETLDLSTKKEPKETKDPEMNGDNSETLKSNPRPGKVILSDIINHNNKIELKGDILDATSWMFPNGVNIRVIRGCWVLYEKPHFEGQAHVLEEGEAVLLHLWGSPGGKTKPENIRIGSVKRVVKDYLPEVVISSLQDSLDSPVQIRAEVSSLENLVDKRPRSLTVNSGVWLAYTEPQYNGTVSVLEEGCSLPCIRESEVKSMRPLKMGGLKVQQPNDPKIIIYEKSHFQGWSREITQHVCSIGELVGDNNDHSDIGSLQVVGGIWVGYENERYKGHQYLLEEGDYEDWQAWGGYSSTLQSFRYLQANFLEASITLFESDFEGVKSVDLFNQAIPDLELAGYNTRTQCIHVERGMWVAYQQKYYCGEQYILEKGRYKSYVDWGGKNNTIMSIRPVLLEPLGRNEAKHLIKIYENDHFQGQSAEFTEEVSNFTSFVPQSIKVLRGCWQLGYQADTCDNVCVLEEGQFPDLASHGCSAAVVKFIRPIDYIFAEPSISLFALDSCEGRELHFEEAVTSILNEHLHFYAQSVWVRRGLWIAFEGANFLGRQMLLDAQKISNWSQFSHWKAIGSLRPLKQPAIYFMVRNRHKDMYLTVTGKITDARATFVNVSQRNGQSTQIWYFSRGFLKSKANDTCLDVIGGKNIPGSKVSLWPEHGKPRQKWKINNDGTVSSYISDDLVLDVKGGNYYDQNYLVVNRVRDQALTQKWDIELL